MVIPAGHIIVYAAAKGFIPVSVRWGIMPASQKSSVHGGVAEMLQSYPWLEETDYATIEVMTRGGNTA